MDRKANQETQLMVDEAILDYLIYTAINSLLDLLDRRVIEGKSTHLPVQMVDAFLPIFRSLHPNYNAPSEIQFRLRLLQFTCVFVRHYHPLSAPSPSSTRQPLIAEDPKDRTSEISEQEHGNAMTLQDTLPLFLALSAVQNAVQGSTITELWMRLAAGYMAQAYAEQVLVYQNKRTGLLEDAFSWGYDDDCGAEKGSNEWQINEMFNADENVVELWEHIKEEHMLAASPCSANNSDRLS
ncbi:MAG: hypothetical protein Q9166_000833 [cf. Caloplaca sp. 2 TL-2023]